MWIPPRDSGVYFIWNVGTKLHYVGRALDIKSRLATHYSQLKNNRHHCGPLQAAYNRDGIGMFDVRWELFEPCELAEQEAYFMCLTAKNFGVYNIKIEHFRYAA